MGNRFLQMASTPGVLAAQEANGSRQLWERIAADRTVESIPAREAAFIGARDSFYLASVSGTGWPYVQHRGGPAGFVKVLDDETLGFADFRGNRQYITLGNTSADDRVALIMVDYPNRSRLKIQAHMSAHDLGADAALAERLALPGYRGRAERGFLLKVVAFDWNCPQHITPRFTASEVEAVVAPLRARLAALEAQTDPTGDHRIGQEPKDLS